MKREDVEKLLGGYAAGTLTADERRALFEAALSDQALFEALADEEPLRDALADPEARAQVAAALREEPPSLFGRWTGRLRVRRGWALGAATAAAAVVVGAIVVETGVFHKTATEKLELAELRNPAPSAEIASPPPKALEMQPSPRAKSVAAPRRLEPPAAVSKQVTPTPESPAIPAGAPLAAVGGAGGGAVGSAPPPPAAVAAQVTAENKPQMMLSRVSSGARALFYEPGTVVAAEKSRDNLMDREQDSAVRAEKRAGVASAPLPQVGDLGLRYSLMRRGDDGQYSEVPLDTALDRGEPARLRIEANQAAQLSVVADGAVLFAGPVAARVPIFVDARPAAFRISLSRRPEVGAAGGALFRASPKIDATDLRKDQPVATEPADKAVYVVNTGPSPDPRVLAEFQLKYR